MGDAGDVARVVTTIRHPRRGNPVPRSRCDVPRSGGNQLPDAVHQAGPAPEEHAGRIAGLGLLGRLRDLELWEQLSRRGDRKTTRLNSSHLGISYAVLCLIKIN